MDGKRVKRVVFVGQGRQRRSWGSLRVRGELQRPQYWSARVGARIGRGQQHGLACRLEKHGADACRDLAHQPQGMEHAARTEHIALRMNSTLHVSWR